MLTRIAMGAIMIFVFTLIICSSHKYIALFVSIIQIICFREVLSVRYKEVKEKNLFGFRTLSWYLMFIAFFMIYGKNVVNFFLPEYKDFNRFHAWITFWMFALYFCAFILGLRTETYKYQFTQLTWAWMTIIITVIWTSFVVLNIYKGIIWFLLPTSLIIFNDIMAYFCGAFLGKKIFKFPFLSLSPNKTWEGFVGAFIFTVFFGWWITKFFSSFNWLICPASVLEKGVCLPSEIPSAFIPQIIQIPSFVTGWIRALLGVEYTSLFIAPIQIHGVVFAIFTSLISPFGGFFASGMKRAFEIKDFDNIFPGHGGMVDRMDCQFITGLFVNIYYLTYVREHDYLAGDIIAFLTNLALAEKMKVFEFLKRDLGL
eukprot:TRINITY_DN4970_c0_g1_i2.p1 TRINITY_DN4970_c0_g1~~TRINITY_DN4970_c0_g1_i2.p1  ORF type:complete len:371 (-),score=87.21 TRINITY_DN4970_c0_g1_i2:8-1120(-)